MKKLLLTLAFFCTFHISKAQSTLVGAETFHIQLPQNFTRAVGVNDLASVQWEHTEKEIYGYVIFENADEMKLVDLSISLKEYSDMCLNDFNEIEKYQLIKSETYTTTNGKETISNKISYYNSELEITIVMQINAYKTQNFYYKVIQYGDEKSFALAEKEIHTIAKDIKLPL